jgi:hypothetical protein
MYCLAQNMNKIRLFRIRQQIFGFHKSRDFFDLLRKCDPVNKGSLFRGFGLLGNNLGFCERKGT